jgi:tetratricopeptide (TPR) repeat protein
MLTTEKIQTETELVQPELNRMTAEEWYGKGATIQDAERKIECFSNAIRLSPRFADAYEARGDEFFDKDDYDMALKDYTRTIHLNPRSGNAFCNRGFAYDALGNYDKAIHDFDRAIRLEPENRHAYIYRGNCHGEKGDYMQALRDGIKARQLAAGPHQDYPHKLKGQALLMLGKPDNAIKEFNEAIKLNPTDPENYCLRGLATAYKGNYEQALEDCNTGIGKGTGDLRSYLLGIRGEVYYHFKRYPEALADFEEYVKKETDAKKISEAKVKISRCKKRIR